MKLRSMGSKQSFRRKRILGRGAKQVLRMLWIRWAEAELSAEARFEEGRKAGFEAGLEEGNKAGFDKGHAVWGKDAWEDAVSCVQREYLHEEYVQL